MTLLTILNPTSLANISISDDLAAIKADVAILRGGIGAIHKVYTWQHVDGTPVANGSVWWTSDAAGSSIIGSGITDQYGHVDVYADPGTIYIWRFKVGETDIVNPDVEAVA